MPNITLLAQAVFLVHKSMPKYKKWNTSVQIFKTGSKAIQVKLLDVKSVYQYDDHNASTSSDIS